MHTCDKVSLCNTVFCTTKIIQMRTLKKQKKSQNSFYVKREKVTGIPSERKILYLKMKSAPNGKTKGTYSKDLF